MHVHKYNLYTLQADMFKDSAVEEITLEAPQQKIFNGQCFPLILTPKSSRLDSNEQVLAWLESERESIQNVLLKYGAVLFRGFPIQSPENFDSFVKAFNFEPLPYVGGAAPRRVITGNVFTANEAPPDQLPPRDGASTDLPSYDILLLQHRAVRGRTNSLSFIQ